MEYISSILSTIGIFIAAIFILVLIHELGHFLAARLFGMRVDRFSIGFPPRVTGIQIGDTDYCISATPLGGYVKIAGMIDESMDDEFLDKDPQPWEFRSKPVWQRMVVISAGVIFNMILAVIIYAGITFSYGDSVIPAKNVGGLFIPDTSLAYQVGFRTGDRVIGVNGQAIQDFNNDIFTLENLTNSGLQFEILRQGEKQIVELPDNFLDQLNRAQAPLFTLVNAFPSQISNVVSGSAADRAGLVPEDKIIAVDGEPIQYWLQLVGHIRGSQGEMAFSVVRSADTLTVSLAPDPVTQTVGIYPVDVETYFGVEFVDYGFFASIEKGFSETLGTFRGITNGLGQLFSGSISVKENLGGPIAIANVTREVTDAGGLRGFWSITAYLSVTLAIMNILPLPVLDGGHLVFLAYEGITRREPSPKFRIAMQQMGLVFFILVFLFVTYNDIMRVILN